MDNQVVITGTGLVSALGRTPSETWESLCSLRSGIRPVDDFDLEGFRCAAAQVHGLGAAELDIHPRDSRIMDKHSYMLMKASRDASREAQLDDGSVPPDERGYFAAMGMVDYNIDDLLPAVLDSQDEKGELDYDRFFSHAYQQIHPLWPLSMLNNISFCQVAIDLGIKGENTTFSPHGDSCVHSFIEAYHAVLEGKASVVLAGGVSEKVSPLSLARASIFNVLNKTDQQCRPFGKGRAGTVLGEGSGIISLELLSNAQKRNIPPLAVLSGYGTSFEVMEDSNSPSSRAISIAMEKAIAMAGLSPSEIDLIIAHGDGTYAGDKHEMDALHGTFSECIKSVRVFSSKAALGHMLGAAPAVDVVLGICMLKNGIIPAVGSSPPLDETVRFTLVTEEPVKADLKKILINSMSYEGQCASMIVEALK